jgi:hypothetical protein
MPPLSRLPRALSQAVRVFDHNTLGLNVTELPKVAAAAREWAATRDGSSSTATGTGTEGTEQLGRAVASAQATRRLSLPAALGPVLFGAVETAGRVGEAAVAGGPFARSPGENVGFPPDCAQVCCYDGDSPSLRQGGFPFHIDCPDVGPHIGILSVGPAPAPLHLVRFDREADSATVGLDALITADPDADWVARSAEMGHDEDYGCVLAAPGTLVVLSGPARYDWLHGSPPSKGVRFVMDGESFARGPRTSVVFWRGWAAGERDVDLSQSDFSQRITLSKRSANRPDPLGFMMKQKTTM